LRRGFIKSWGAASTAEIAANAADGQKYLAILIVAARGYFGQRLTAAMVAVASKYLAIICDQNHAA
jgi:hypothetical protein